MTDLEVKRQAVINAARGVINGEHGPGITLPARPEAFYRLHDALAALDEAEKPDPWKALKEAQIGMYVLLNEYSREAAEEYYEAVCAALAWREENPDD